MMVSLVQVPNSYVAKLWPQVVPHLLKGRKYWEDFYGLEDFLTMCIRGDLQLWVYIRDKKIKSIGLTALITYPKATYLRYLYVGGEDLRVWREYAYVMENWAKANGATGWEVLGRPGWERIVKKHFAHSSIFEGAYFQGKF